MKLGRPLLAIVLVLAFRSQVLAQQWTNQIPQGGPLTANLNANSNRITSLALPMATTDALSCAGVSQDGTCNATGILNITQAGGGTGNFKAGAFISGAANPSTTGVVRLANGDSIAWRNAANSLNITGITIGVSNALQLGDANTNTVLLNTGLNVNANNITAVNSVQGPNNLAYIQEADSGGVQRRLLRLDASNIEQVGDTGVTTVNLNAGSGGTTQLQASNGSIVAANGATIQSSGGAAPTATACGTTPSVVAGSTNNRGTITTGSTATTSCTLNFSAAGTWAQAPFCEFYDANASITPVAFSEGACGTSTCVVDYASATSIKIGYQCF